MVFVFVFVFGFRFGFRLCSWGVAFAPLLLRLVGCEVAVPPFVSLPTSTVRGFYYCSSSAFCFCCH